jgi:predicted MFS family arabinose efflux permease
MPALSRRASFWLVGAMILLFFLASAVPSPLYVVYQQEWRFSATTLTLVFAVYVLALLAALLTVGGLSDFIGRRPVLVGALALEAGSMVLFLAADSVTWLYAARVVQGVATGAAAGTLSAALADLAPPSRPRNGALLNAVAPAIGLAFGALISGLVLDHVSSPTDLLFTVLVGVFVALSLSALVLPGIDQRRPGALASLRPRVAIPPRVRGAFLVVTPALVASWALGGLYLSLGGSIAVGILGLHQHVSGGLVIFTLTGMGALTGLVLNRWTPERVMTLGCWALIVGLGLTLVALDTTSTALFFVGTAIAGIGFGASFQGAFRTLTVLALPEERAELFASLFTVSYIAFSVPAIVAGLAITQYGLRPVANAYAGVVIALSLIALASYELRRRAAARRAALVTA